MSIAAWYLLLLIIVPLYIFINNYLRKRFGCDDSRLSRPYVSGCIHKMRGHHGHIRK